MLTIVLLGGPRTGKTAIVNRIVYNSFDIRYLPTIEDHYRHTFAKSTTETQIIDFGGTYEGFSNLQRLKGDILFLFVFDLTQLDTFLFLNKIHNNVCFTFGILNGNVGTPTCKVRQSRQRARTNNESLFDIDNDLSTSAPFFPSMDNIFGDSRALSHSPSLRHSDSLCTLSLDHECAESNDNETDVIIRCAVIGTKTDLAAKTGRKVSVEQINEFCSSLVSYYYGKSVPLWMEDSVDETIEDCESSITNTVPHFEVSSLHGIGISSCLNSLMRHMSAERRRLTRRRLGTNEPQERSGLLSKHKTGHMYK